MIVDWPCGSVSIIGAQPPGKALPTDAMWNDHRADCNDPRCAPGGQS